MESWKHVVKLMSSLIISLSPLVTIADTIDGLTGVTGQHKICLGVGTDTYDRDGVSYRNVFGVEDCQDKSNVASTDWIVEISKNGTLIKTKIGAENWCLDINKTEKNVHVLPGGINVVAKRCLKSNIERHWHLRVGTLYTQENDANQYISILNKNPLLGFNAVTIGSKANNSWNTSLTITVPELSGITGTVLESGVIEYTVSKGDNTTFVVQFTKDDGYTLREKLVGTQHKYFPFSKVYGQPQGTGGIAFPTFGATIINKYDRTHLPIAGYLLKPNGEFVVELSSGKTTLLYDKNMVDIKSLSSEIEKYEVPSACKMIDPNPPTIRYRIEASLRIDKVSGGEPGGRAEFFGSVNFKLKNTKDNQFITPVRIGANRNLDRSVITDDDVAVFVNGDKEEEVLLGRGKGRHVALFAYKEYDLSPEQLGNIKVEATQIKWWESDSISNTEFTKSTNIEFAPSLSSMLKKGINTYITQTSSSGSDQLTVLISATPACGAAVIYQPSIDEDPNVKLDRSTYYSVMNLTNKPLYGLNVVYYRGVSDDLNSGPGSMRGESNFASAYDVPPATAMPVGLNQIDLSFGSVFQVVYGHFSGVLLFRKKDDRDTVLKNINNKNTASFIRTIADLMISLAGVGGRIQQSASSYALAASTSSKWIDLYAGSYISYIDSQIDKTRLKSNLTANFGDFKYAAGCGGVIPQLGARSEDLKTVLVTDTAFTCTDKRLPMLFGETELCRWMSKGGFITNSSLPDYLKEDNPLLPFVSSCN